MEELLTKRAFKVVRTKKFGISFLIYMTMLFSSLPIMAANGTHTLINYTETEVYLYSAVQAIADQAGLDFDTATSYTNIGSSCYQNISVAITDATWSEAMEIILVTQNDDSLTPLTYRIVNSKIILYCQETYPTKATLAMNFFPKGDGSTSPASGASTTVITRDTWKAITATPITGYHFVKWTSSATAEIADYFSSSTYVKIADLTNKDEDIAWNADATAIAWFEEDDLTNGLVAYYPFNGNATDESGKGNDGTVNGATLVPDKFGNLDRAYSFDGVNDYINCGKGTSMDLSTFSVSYWVKSDHVPDTGSNSYIMSKGGNYTSCWDHSSNPNPGIMFYDGTDWHYSNPTSAFSANKWYHIVATYNQDSLKVYVNGTLKNTTFASETPQTNTDPLCIGASSTFSGFFKGTIDNLRVYDRVLGTSEITKLYNLSSAKLTTSSSPAAAGSVTPSPNIIVNAGDYVPVTAYPKAGYRFSKWVISGTATMDGDDDDELTTQINTVYVKASSTVTAYFVADKTHKLVSLYSPYPVGPTDEITVQNAVIQCLNQVGMQYDTTNSNINVTASVSAQKITPDIHDVLWSDALFTVLDPLGLTYKIESSKVVLYRQSQLPGQSTLVMNFTPSGGGITSPYSGASMTTVTTGESFNIQALPSANYHFVNWTCSDNATITAATSASTTAKLSKDSTITANFAHDTATLTMDAANGTTTPSIGDSAVSTATAIPITATPAANYHFVNWTVVSGSVTIANANSASTTVTLNGGTDSAATIRANFAHDTATLTITKNGNGTVNPAAGTYLNQNTATPIAITATPVTGYHLVNWAVIGSATVADPDSASTTLTLTGANNSKVTLTATFAIDNYQVDFVSGGNGTVTGITAQHVNYGSDCTSVTAVPATDYHFTGWTSNGGPYSANPLSITNVSGPMTITANFAHNQGTINTDITGTGSTTIDDGPYDTKTGYNIAAVDTDATNFEFINWTVSGEGAVADAGDATTTVNLTGQDGCSMTATANFFPLANVLSPTEGTPSTVTGMADSEESINVYRVTVPSGITRMVVSTSSSGETGDSDIYLGKGFIPSVETYTAKSTEDGLEDSVEILNPDAANWYIMIYGYAEYSGVDMTVSFFSDVPIAPTLSSASSDKTDRVTLTWDGGTGTTATSYDVYRSRSISSDMVAKIGNNVGNVSTWDDTSAVLGTPYYYWIRAKNASGDSAFSNCLVGGLNGTPLTVILKSGVAIAKISGDAGSSSKYQITTPASPAQALLEINASIGIGDCDMTVADGDGVSIYSVRITSNETVRIENPPVSETYTITLYANSAYSGLTLMAKYYSATPAAPTGVAASDGIYPDAVLVSWKESAGATSYEVWRAEKTGSTAPKSSDASLWAETSDSSFFDNINVDEGKIYYYWVKADNPAGSSAFSTSNSGYVSNVPGMPSSVAASDGTYFDKIRVTWPKVSGATSYLIYRNSSEVMPGTPIAKVAYDSTKATYTYDDMGGADPSPNTGKSKYYYWVEANNANGPGIAKMNTGYIKNTGPTGVSASKGTFFEQVKLTWTAVAGATSYNIYRSQDPSVPGSVFDTATTPTYYDTTVDGTQVYYYWVEADCNGDYSSNLSKSGSGYAKTTVPKLSAPVMKSASNGTYSKEVVLTWGEVPLAVSYNVYRRILTTDPWETPVNASDLTYTDGTAVPLQKYLYAVTAVNGEFESAKSTSKTGYAAGSGTETTNDATVSVLGTKGNEQLFYIDVPENCTRLVAKAENVNLGGSCDIYAKLGSCPTTTSYTAKGTLIAGTKADKSLTVTNPATGRWYILVYGSGTVGYTEADLTVSYHYATDILLTQVPADDLAVPFTATFKGKLQDESGTGIPGFSIGVRDPVTGLQTWLTAKTDANGLFTYSTKISGEGEYTYDFFLTSIPDDTRTIASWTVRTKRNPWETNGFFDFVGYIPATTVSLSTSSPADLSGMQEFITIRRGFEDGPVNSTYADMWIDSTLVKASEDANILAKLDTGLYFLLYGTEGAATGNGKSVNPGLAASPLLVHIASDNLATVIGNLKENGLIDNEFADNVASDGIGVMAITTVDNPEEDTDGIYDISLNAYEQLEIIANLAGNSSITVDISNEKKYGAGLITKLVNTLLGDSRKIGMRIRSFYSFSDK
jgi:fibronectin type 3 domain-containing protein